MKIIECPRDAMQGIKDFIDTDLKAKYINRLLKVGFDTVDFGSFVSPKAIPQMKDTSDLLNKLDLSNSSSKLLSIVANKRGATQACEFDEVNYLGFPFSISETFQLRNTNSTIQESFSRLSDVKNLCDKNGKQLVVYISMGFGNPYGDAYSSEIVAEWSEKLNKKLGVNILALSDTIGVSEASNIKPLFEHLINTYPEIEFGAHLHTTPNSWEEKVKAAFEAGCRRFDGAIKGYGGCPMAKDELTGNMPTEKMIEYFDINNINHGLNLSEFHQSMLISKEIFHE